MISNTRDHFLQCRLAILEYLNFISDSSQQRNRRASKCNTLLFLSQTGLQEPQAAGPAADTGPKLATDRSRFLKQVEVRATRRAKGYTLSRNQIFLDFSIPLQLSFLDDGSACLFVHAR